MSEQSTSKDNIDVTLIMECESGTIELTENVEPISANHKLYEPFFTMPDDLKILSATLVVSASQGAIVETINGEPPPWEREKNTLLSFLVSLGAQ